MSDSTQDCAAIVRPEWPDATRRDRFEAWLAGLVPAHELRPDTLRLASADASFRRYLRIDTARGTRAGDDPHSLIVMDAPPPQEDVRPFVDVAARLTRASVAVPDVLAVDAEHGFVLLGDLGQRLLLGELHAAESRGDARESDRMMREAVQMLVRMQSAASPAGLPAFDDAMLRRELDLFPAWCVERELGQRWGDPQLGWWRSTCDLLVARALAQPSVFVHRDYMPRNLMRREPPLSSPGVLDFQDAVRGPVTYDIVCLLRDAFISWDEERELDWAVRWWEAARRAGVPVGSDFGALWPAIEWMGVQRHLKVLGIFCRLKHRDGKPAYSADLPRFFRYVHRVATRYRELAPLVRLIEPLMGESRIEAFY